MHTSDHSRYIAHPFSYDSNKREAGDFDLKAYIDERIAAQIGGSSSYLVYTALLSQSGTDAPVATVLQNTLGGDVVWTRNTLGIYDGTLLGAFPANRTIFPACPSTYSLMPLFISVPYDNSLQPYRVNDNNVQIAVYNNTGSLIEWSSVLDTTVFIEIRVYP